MIAIIICYCIYVHLIKPKPRARPPPKKPAETAPPVAAVKKEEPKQTSADADVVQTDEEDHAMGAINKTQDEHSKTATEINLLDVSQGKFARESVMLDKRDWYDNTRA